MVPVAQLLPLAGRDMGVAVVQFSLAGWAITAVATHNNNKNSKEREKVCFILKIISGF